MIDTYATLTLQKDKDDYVARLRTPLSLGINHNARVALCDIYYARRENDGFDNASISVLDIFIPKYTYQEDGTPDGIRCQLENAQYSAASLCRALNNEIAAKMPSEYNKNKCFFWFNTQLNRVELRIDGTDSVPQDERATIIVYHPLSFYLGLTDDPERRISFSFVSNNLIS